MYNEQDMNKINGLIRNQIIVLSIYSLIMLGGVAATVVVWQQLLSMAAVAVYLFGVIFIGDLKLMPLLRYRRFLRDMRDGLSRNASGKWNGMDEDIMFRDGVAIHAVFIDEGNEVPRQLYWDVDKSLPSVCEGQEVRLETHGAFIKKLEIVS